MHKLTSTMFKSFILSLKQLCRCWYSLEQYRSRESQRRDTSGRCRSRVTPQEQQEYPHQLNTLVRSNAVIIDTVVVGFRPLRELWRVPLQRRLCRLQRPKLVSRGEWLQCADEPCCPRWWGGVSRRCDGPSSIQSEAWHLVWHHLHGLLSRQRWVCLNMLLPTPCRLNQSPRICWTVYMVRFYLLKRSLSLPVQQYILIVGRGNLSCTIVLCLRVEHLDLLSTRNQAENQVTT